MPVPTFITRHKQKTAQVRHLANQSGQWTQGKWRGVLCKMACITSLKVILIETTNLMFIIFATPRAAIANMQLTLPLLLRFIILKLLVIETLFIVTLFKRFQVHIYVHILCFISLSNSSLVLTLHIWFSFVRPNILLKIFLSKTNNFWIMASFNTHVSEA